MCPLDQQRFVSRGTGDHPVDPRPGLWLATQSPTVAPVAGEGARDRELAELFTALQGVRAGERAMVALDGFDGVGKTHLSGELVGLVGKTHRPIVTVSIDGFHHPKAKRDVGCNGVGRGTVCGDGAPWQRAVSRPSRCQPAGATQPAIRRRAAPLPRGGQSAGAKHLDLGQRRPSATNADKVRTVAWPPTGGCPRCSGRPNALEQARDLRAR